MHKKLYFYEAINLAIQKAMSIDKEMVAFGLGINDPKAIFNTTKGLQKIFGSKRVFDVPTSENAITGIANGLGISGIKSIVTHQRLDFFLLAMDQIINSASKWHYMFGGSSSIPTTTRLIIGRGWGQGPTHSQSLQSVFMHFPGLKVVMPSSPQNAYELLLRSIFDKNPVLFLEHRWLHNLKSNVKLNRNININKKVLQPDVIKRGKDLTIVSMSYATNEAIQVATEIKKRDKIDIEVIDLNIIKPLRIKNIINSVKKTKRIICLDTSFYTGSVSSEIISEVSIQLHNLLLSAPRKLALPDIPEPTSFGLTKKYYYTKDDIIKEIKFSLGIKKKLNVENCFSKPKYHDVPGNWFTGPF